MATGGAKGAAGGGWKLSNAHFGIFKAFIFVRGSREVNFQRIGQTDR